MTLPPDLSAWRSAQPVDGPQEEWNAWWAQRPSGLVPASLARALTAAVLPKRAYNGETEKPAFRWLLPALCAEAEPRWLTDVPKLEGFLVGSVAFPSPLHAITGCLRMHGFARVAQTLTEDDRKAHRRLFETLMAAIPPEDSPLLSAASSAQSPEAFCEIGARLLGIAYRLEAWPEAERLEALGQTPDGAGGAGQPSSMFLGSVAAWERALAQGWDPKERLGENAWTSVPRWRRWIGQRLPSHNETNDPLMAHAVSWARTHDPVELESWLVGGCLVAARNACSEEEAAAAWRLMEPRLPDVLHVAGPEPLWFGALANRPDLWATRLEPYFDAIAAHAARSTRADLISHLGNSRSPEVWMRVPEVQRRRVLDLCLGYGQPPANGLLSTVGPFSKDSPYARWLAAAMPPDWLWGSNPALDAPTMAQVMGRVSRLKKPPVDTMDPMLTAARIHPPPPAWVPLVALIAATARQAPEVGVACARQPWSAAMHAALDEMAQYLPQPAAAVRAAVEAHGLDGSLARSRSPSGRPRL